MEYFFARPKHPNETWHMEKYADGKRLPYYIENFEVLQDVINHNMAHRYTKIPKLKGKHVTKCLLKDSFFPQGVEDYAGWKEGDVLLVTHVIKIGSVYVVCDDETNRNARLQACRLSTEEEIKSYNDYIQNELYVR